MDSSEGAKVYQSYIEEQKETIESTYSDFESLSQEINQTINSVSDLVSVIKPNFHEITTKKNILTRIINDLVQNMGDFSNQADTAKMREMLKHIQLLMNNAQAKKGEERFTEFYIGDSKKAKEKLDKWVDSRRDKTSLEKVSDWGDIAKNYFKYSSYTGMASQVGSMAIILKTMTRDERSKFLKTGLHLDQDSYIRYNNLLTNTNIYRVTNRQFMDVAKQIVKGKMNPLKALQSAPFTDIRGKNAMKKEFARLLDLQKYQDFKKLPPGQKALSMMKTFGNEFIGDKVKTTKNIITQTNWKKPQTLMTTVVDEVKGKTKGLNVLGKIGKLAGPLGAGLHIADNFNQHKGNTQKAIVGSAVDIAGSSVAAATGAAVGSLIVPPIGTVVGAGVGALVGYSLNMKMGKPPKSTLDHVKEKTNKVVSKVMGWFK
ncbi:T7SS effector LXG polymorphic toxin [Pseudogracilibacillus sp. SO30301A]|uniref:T7SS effector LXG polymorphic toxin n=1 Tax=Pseudogracilibacillus sp. SO30301A TaxID=3098291 RepID=UPI00300DE326